MTVTLPLVGYDLSGYNITPGTPATNPLGDIINALHNNGVGPAGPPGGIVGAYGAFHDNGTYQILDPTAEYAIPLGVTDFSSNVSAAPNGLITFAVAGVYNVQFSAQLRNTNTGQPNDAFIWVKKNGVNVPACGGALTIAAQHASTPGAIVASWNLFVSMTAGQTLQFFWSGNNTTLWLETVPEDGTPHHPTSPAMIVTVTQVA